MPKPLSFVRSVPRNGATGVSTNLRTILLVFDKNVVNDAVWTNNRKQIKLLRGTTRVSIRVARIPDTVDFSKRRNIYVHPVHTLRPSTRYRVVIGPNLTSKAGEKLGKTVTVTFKTRSVTPEE
ncbi:MAG TPA: Ig-like domain-containing protein [Syntrophomonadaceae bacterium]|nr:Ig-like domain-containing protein [Syntrophomonadaceae bacterium]